MLPDEAKWKKHVAVNVVPHFLANFFEEIRKLLLPFLSGLPGQRATRKEQVTTSGFERGLTSPGCRQYPPARLQDKLTVDKFADAENVEGDLRMDNGEVLI